MGLFDGQIGGEGFASTAHVAELVGAPVVLVIDISQLSRTAAAVVHGLSTFEPGRTHRRGDPQPGRLGPARPRGPLRARGDGHRGARGAAAGRRYRRAVPPSRSGTCRRTRRSRRGDRPAGRAGGRARRPAARCWPSHTAPRLWTATRGTRPRRSDRRRIEGPVVAVAGGRAFTFRYPETEELLRAAGCEPVVFDPTSDDRLPAGTAGLYLGGGFPEVHAAELAANEPLRSAVRAAPYGPESRPWPSAPGCCTCATRSTASRWPARSTRRRR